MAKNPPASVSPHKLILVLSVGLICVSLGSILIRLSHEAPSLSIAFFRMLWATAFLSPFFWFRGSRPQITSWPLQLVVGVALALHFAFWIASLRYTSVAVSVLLVNTSPLLVAACSCFLWNERLSFRGVLGIFASFFGATILLWNDLYQFGQWKGAALALLGAIMLAIYLLLGRRFRQRTSLLGYVYPTYLLAAAVLGILVLVTKTPLQGFSGRTYLFLMLLGLLPQCAGHTSYNWALRYLSATLVSMLTLGEPVLATLLAWWILGEKITLWVVFGGGLVAAGIVTVSRWGILKPGHSLSSATPNEESGAGPAEEP